MKHQSTVPKPEDKIKSCVSRLGNLLSERDEIVDNANKVKFQ